MKAAQTATHSEDLQCLLAKECENSKRLAVLIAAAVASLFIVVSMAKQGRFALNFARWRLSPQHLQNSLLFKRHLQANETAKDDINNDVYTHAECVEDRCCGFSPDVCEGQLPFEYCSSVTACLQYCEAGPNQRNSACFSDACGCTEEYLAIHCPPETRRSDEFCPSTNACLIGCCYYADVGTVDDFDCPKRPAGPSGK